MGYIFVDREGDGGNIRNQMRRSMRTTNRHDGTMPMMHGGEGWEHGYRMGYKHGWEDSENDMDEEFRRSRDSRGRFV